MIGASARTRRPRRFHLCCEALEVRRLLAVMMVKDINPAASSAPYSLAAMDGALYFAASDGEHGSELWKSDGTPQGTTLVKDIVSGPDGAYPGILTPADGTLYFFTGEGSLDGHLWKTDGTEAGTVRLKDFGAENALYYLYDFETIGGTLYFTAYDDIHGVELWTSDGTPEGTHLVKDLVPGSSDGYPRSSYPDDFAELGGKLYFTADDALGRTSLWKSDGTAAGTVRVAAFGSGVHFGFPDSLTVVGETLFFAVEDDRHGRELWKSDGTLAGTALVKDITPGKDVYGYPYSSRVYDLTNVGDTLYFTADDGVSGSEIWKSDGTAEGTVQVADIAPGPDGITANYLSNVEGTLYFFRDGGRVRQDQLWKSDGTARGTVYVADVQPQVFGRYGSDPARQPTYVDGTLYFVASIGPPPPPPCPRCAQPPGNSELWISDGTRAGTVPLLEILPGSTGSFPNTLTAMGDKLFFTATDGIHGRELWVATSDDPDVPGDTNGDGDVDLVDLNNVRNHFGDVGPDVLGDANGDGVIDLGDLNDVRNHFGASSGSASTPASPRLVPPPTNRSETQLDVERHAGDAIFARWSAGDANRESTNSDAISALDAATRTRPRGHRLPALMRYRLANS